MPMCSTCDKELTEEQVWQWNDFDTSESLCENCYGHCVDELNSAYPTHWDDDGTPTD